MGIIFYEIKRKGNAFFREGGTLLRESLPGTPIGERHGDGAVHTNTIRCLRLDGLEQKKLRKCTNKSWQARQQHTHKHISEKPSHSLVSLYGTLDA